MSQQNAIAKMGWREFEQFIARLFEALGYVNIQLTPDIGDEGKDIEVELPVPMGGNDEIPSRMQALAKDVCRTPRCPETALSSCYWPNGGWRYHCNLWPVYFWCC